ncbi:carnitine dehydratase [Caballeronia pedi]|uniref:Carnitine dehydratase n=2 Tax=Caballeronia pedi TaxID=1777141 RepID=A0A157ZQZ7_9BURK|nr:carnitine dehydratase [Caballeronia pedi]
MCGMFLADHGVDVIKVERPQVGDEIRRSGETKDGVGLFYKVLNRGKRSVTLDLKTEIGAEALKKLVKDVDMRAANRGSDLLSLSVQIAQSSCDLSNQVQSFPLVTG